MEITFFAQVQIVSFLIIQTVFFTFVKMSIANLEGDTVTFIFVRHAETEANTVIHERKPEESLQSVDEAIQKVHESGPVELTLLGCGQARVTGTYLAELLVRNSHKWGTQINILNSNQHRCIKTAIYARDRMKGHLLHMQKQDDRIPEFTFPHFQDGITTLNEYNSFTKEGVGIPEASFQDFSSRVLSFYQYLQTLEHTTIVFGHSIFFSTLFTHMAAQGRYMPDDVENLAFHVPNCSITMATFSKDTGIWSFILTASTQHLGPTFTTGLHYNS